MEIRRSAWCVGGGRIARQVGTPQKPLQRAYQRDPEAIEAGSANDILRLPDRQKPRAVKCISGMGRAFVPMACTARPGQEGLDDELLSGEDPLAVFAKDGLLEALKKALAERILDAELEHHLRGERIQAGRGTPRNIATGTAARRC
jgi:hypothetical protein